MTKYRYQLSETATRKLEHEIAYSRKKWGVNHANKYRRDLLAVVRKISKSPTLLAERPEIGKGIRCARFKGNYIVYRLNENKDGIIVLNFPSVNQLNLTD